MGGMGRIVDHRKTFATRANPYVQTKICAENLSMNQFQRAELVSASHIAATVHELCVAHACSYAQPEDQEAAGKALIAMVVDMLYHDYSTPDERQS